MKFVKNLFKALRLRFEWIRKPKVYYDPITQSLYTR